MSAVSFSPFLKAEAKDIGISYFEGLPVCSTHLLSYRFGRSITSTNQDEESRYFLDYGYRVGSTGAILYDLAERTVSDKAHFSARPFAVTANDFTYVKLIDPLASKGVKDEIAFFFVSEMLTQIGSVEALRRAGFIDGLLWVKLSTYCLLHAERALGSFSAFVHDEANAALYSDDFVSELSSIFTRTERKVIRSTRKLRNAFVHYDFKTLADGLELHNANLWEITDAIVLRAVGMSREEYERFLLSVSMSAVERLSKLVCFPLYDPGKNVFN